MQLCYELAIEH